MPKQKAETQKALLARDLQLVYGLALFCTGGPAQAQAICQKVFVDHMQQELPFFREEGRKNWILRRTVHLCRKKEVGRKIEFSTVKTCFDRKAENTVFQGLCGFPFRYRVVLYLSLFSGLPCEEIGKALHKREGFVREDLVQARKKLYRLFSDLSIAMEDGKRLMESMRRQMMPSPQSVESVFQMLQEQQRVPSIALRTGKAAFAAFLCLLVVTLAVGVPKLLIRPPITPSVFPTVSSDESDQKEKWSQLGISEQYPEVSLGGETYISRVHKISIERIGALLSNMEITQTDEKKKKHRIHVELYEIKQISTRCAIAVHYEGYDGFYVFVNPSYQPNTLGDFLESLNCKETLSFGNVYFSGWKEAEYVQIEYSLENLPDVVWDLLLSNSDAPLYPHQEYEEEVLVISMNLNDFGYENIALSITKDGFLQTNLLETGKIFYIGPEKTKAFADYIYRHAKSRNLSLGSGTVNQSQSPYHKKAEDLQSSPD